jgi:hypothetical protein
LKTGGKMTKLILSLLAVSWLLRADFDGQHWQFRRSIQVREKAAISAFTVDASVYRDSRAQLNDLRIICSGLETPYQIQTLSGKQQEMELLPAMLDKAVIAHAGLQAVLDLKGHQQHNRLRIVTGQSNFRETVRVETSDDGRNWALVRDDGTIFDISREDRHISELTVEYPVSTRRYLRLTIPGWNDPAYLQSARLIYWSQTPAVRDTITTLKPVISQDSHVQTTLLLLDAGFNGIPYDHLEFSVGPSVFRRDIEIFSSSDGKQWVFVGGGVISKTVERSQLSVQIAEQWTRYVKVVIFNRDNLPLAVEGVILSGVRRVIRFPSAEPGPYWLYSGNGTAKEPLYDFAWVMPHTVNASIVTLGKKQLNEQYQPTRPPWSDQHPQLLTAVLILAVMVMGYTTLRFLIKLKTV